MPETRPSEPAPQPAHPEWTYLGNAQIDQLAGLVMELAGQLHVERTRVSALEDALVRAGVLDRTAPANTADPGRAGHDSRGLDRSIAGLLRVLAEGNDARGPLRADQIGEA